MRKGQGVSNNKRYGFKLVKTSESLWQGGGCGTSCCGWKVFDGDEELGDLSGGGTGAGGGRFDWNFWPKDIDPENPDHEKKNYRTSYPTRERALYYLAKRLGKI